MSKRWISALLSLTIVSLLFTECKKKYSSDDPLPTSYYPSIIINSDNMVFYGIDPVTGKKNWEFSLPHLSGVPTTVFTPSPLLYNGMLYLTAINSDTVYKVDARTGLLVKKLTPCSGYGTIPTTSGLHYFTVIATPVADGNTIYLPTTNDTMYAIDTGTGNIKWKYASGSDLSPLASSPTVFNGNVYYASTGGHVYCLNKTTGPDVAGLPVWDYPGPGIVLTPMPSFISSPAICAPFLFLGSVTDSNMYCIFLTPPTPALATARMNVSRWTFKTGGAITGSPTAFAGKCIFGSTDFYVYCVDTTTATAVWTHRTNSRINSSAIIDNQTVYIGSDDYNLYALNIINGNVKWGAPFNTSGALKSSPLPYNGMIYIGSYDGNLYAVDSAQGTLKWKYYINGNIESSPVINDLTGNNTNVSQVSGFKN